MSSREQLFFGIGEIADSIIAEAENYVPSQKRQLWKPAIAACLVLIFLAIPVYAEIANGYVSNLLAPLFGGTQTEIVDKIGRPLGANAAVGEYTLTADAIIGDGYSVGMVFTLKRTDGKPIDDSLRFEDVEIPIDRQSHGETHGYVRSEDGKSLKITLEWDGTKRIFLNRNITIRFRNLIKSAQDGSQKQLVTEGCWDLKVCLRYEEISQEIEIETLKVLGAEGLVYEIEDLYISPYGVHLKATVPNVNGIFSGFSLSAVSYNGEMISMEGCCEESAKDDREAFCTVNWSSRFRVPVPMKSIRELVICGTHIPLGDGKISIGGELDTHSQIPPEPFETVQADPAYHPESDYPYMYKSSEIKIAETPDGYYYRDSFFLYYIDKKTMEAEPMCHKPSCKHNLETDHFKVPYCDAFIAGSTADSILQYMNGHIYLTLSQLDLGSNSNQILMEMDPDGTNRRKVLEIPATAGEMILHRGYLYYAGISCDENRNTCFGIIRQDLQGGRPEMLCKGSNQGVGHFGGLTALGDTIFFHESGRNEEKIPYQYVWSYNLITREKKQIEQALAGEILGYPAIYNGKVLSSVWTLGSLENDKGACRYYLSALDGTGKALLPFPEMDTKLMIASDGNSLWRIPREFRKPDDPVIQKLSKDFSVEGAYFDFPRDRLFFVVMGGENHLFLQTSEGEEDVVYAIDKKPVNGVLHKKECYRSGKQANGYGMDGAPDYQEIWERVPHRGK